MGAGCSVEGAAAVGGTEKLTAALGAGPDGWLMAAAAAHALGGAADARLLFGRARERTQVGYECLHRWARHEALAAALAGAA